jgi:hypothetical protein
VTDLNLFFRFGIALVIGILIGLQREYAFDEPEKELFAGVRTFALMALIGCAGALLSDATNSPWPIIIILFVIGAFLAITYFVDASKGKVGLTTEISAVLTVLLGALAYWDQVVLAVGSRPLRLSILPGYLLMMATGVAVAFLI